MRLLIAILEEKKALEVRLRLYGMDEHWDVRVAENGLQAVTLLEMERWDVLLLDSRLRADGTSLWEKLCAAPPLCPPRVLALWQDGPRPAADGAVPADGLNGIDDELVVQLARNHLIAGAFDHAADFLRKYAGQGIRPRARLLNRCHAHDHFAGQTSAGDRKIFRRPQRVDAVISVRIHRHRSHQVLLCSAHRVSCSLAYVRLTTV